MTRWPRAASALGKLPLTSPRPPVLLNGAACTSFVITTFRCKLMQRCDE